MAVTYTSMLAQVSDQDSCQSSKAHASVSECVTCFYYACVTAYYYACVSAYCYACVTCLLFCFVVRGRPPSDHDDRDPGSRFNNGGGSAMRGGRRDDIPLEVCMCVCVCVRCAISPLLPLQQRWRLCHARRKKG